MERKMNYVNKIVAKGTCKRKKSTEHRIEWWWTVPSTVAGDYQILRTTVVEICCIECAKRAICQQYPTSKVKFSDLSTYIKRTLHVF